jgi:hypothetical protein
VGDFGKQTRVSMQDSTAGPAAARQPTPGKTTLTEALSVAAPVQRKATGASAEATVDAAPPAAAEVEEDFKPSID